MIHIQELKNTMHGIKISFNNPARQYANHKDELLGAADAVLSSGQLLDGTYVKKLESTIATYTGRKYAVATNSCSTALNFICRHTMPVNQIGRIAAPGLSYIATANAMPSSMYLTPKGMDTVSYSDVDENGLFDFYPTNNTSSPEYIMSVNLFGLIPDYDKFRHRWLFEHMYNLDEKVPLLFEDAAQSFGSTLNGKPAGSFGDYSFLSFDPTKVLNCSTGGMLLTNEKDTADLLRTCCDNGLQLLKDGILRGDTRFTGFNLTSNLKMTEIDAAMLLVKLKYVDRWQARRKQIGEYYRDRFKNYEIKMLIPSTNCDWNYSRFPIRFQHSNIRNQILIGLDNAGIGNKIHYGYSFCDGPNIKSFTDNSVSIPIYAELTDSEIEVIADKVIDSFLTTPYSVSRLQYENIG